MIPPVRMTGDSKILIKKNTVSEDFLAPRWKIVNHKHFWEFLTCHQSLWCIQVHSHLQYLKSCMALYMTKLLDSHDHFMVDSEISNVVMFLFFRCIILIILKHTVRFCLFPQRNIWLLLSNLTVIPHSNDIWVTAVVPAVNWVLNKQTTRILVWHCC